MDTTNKTSIFGVLIFLTLIFRLSLGQTAGPESWYADTPGFFASSHFRAEDPFLISDLSEAVNVNSGEVGKIEPYILASCSGKGHGWATVDHSLVTLDGFNITSQFTNSTILTEGLALASTGADNAVLLNVLSVFQVWKSSERKAYAWNAQLPTFQGFASLDNNTYGAIAIYDLLQEAKFAYGEITSLEDSPIFFEIPGAFNMTLTSFDEKPLILKNSAKHILLLSPDVHSEELFIASYQPKAGPSEFLFAACEEIFLIYDSKRLTAFDSSLKAIWARQFEYSGYVTGMTCYGGENLAFSMETLTPTVAFGVLVLSPASKVFENSVIRVTLTTPPQVEIQAMPLKKINGKVEYELTEVHFNTTKTISAFEFEKTNTFTKLFSEDRRETHPSTGFLPQDGNYQ